MVANAIPVRFPSGHYPIRVTRVATAGGAHSEFCTDLIASQIATQM